MDRRTLLRSVVAASLTPAFAALIPAWADEDSELIFTDQEIYELANRRALAQYPPYEEARSLIMLRTLSDIKRDATVAGKVLVIEHRAKFRSFNYAMVIFADKFVIVTRHGQRIVHKDKVSGRAVLYVEA
jgi:hypothetical protein